jgi:hypothetical protein
LAVPKFRGQTLDRNKPNQTSSNSKLPAKMNHADFPAFSDTAEYIAHANIVKCVGRVGVPFN